MVKINVYYRYEMGDEQSFSHIKVTHCVDQTIHPNLIVESFCSTDNTTSYLCFSEILVVVHIATRGRTLLSCKHTLDCFRILSK